MGARTKAAWGGLVVLAAGLLLGCNGGGDDSSPAAVDTPLSAAETEVGAAMLPPDGSVAAADSLDSSDLPPDATASDAVAGDDLPPAG